MSQGNHFGLTQNAGMGWNYMFIKKTIFDTFTCGGLKDKDGDPIALGFHKILELSTLVENAENL